MVLNTLFLVPWVTSPFLLNWLNLMITKHVIQEAPPRSHWATYTCGRAGEVDKTVRALPCCMFWMLISTKQTFAKVGLDPWLLASYWKHRYLGSGCLFWFFIFRSSNLYLVLFVLGYCFHSKIFNKELLGATERNKVYRLKFQLFLKPWPQWLHQLLLLFSWRCAICISHHIGEFLKLVE